MPRVATIASSTTSPHLLIVRITALPIIGSPATSFARKRTGPSRSDNRTACSLCPVAYPLTPGLKTTSRGRTARCMNDANGGNNNAPRKHQGERAEARSPPALGPLSLTSWGKCPGSPSRPTQSQGTFPRPRAVAPLVPDPLSDDDVGGDGGHAGDGQTAAP